MIKHKKTLPIKSTKKNYCVELYLQGLKIAKLDDVETTRILYAFYTNYRDVFIPFF